MLTGEDRLGEARRLYQAGEFAAAARAGRPVLKAHPDHPGVLHLLGAALARAGETGEAKRHLRKLVRVRARSPEAHFELSYALQAEGKLSEALVALERGSRECPDCAFLLRARAELLRMMRRQDEAIALLQPMIDSGARDPDVLVAYAAACAGARERRRLIDLASRLDIDGIPREHRMHLLFALGRALEAEGDAAAAFDAYLRANACKQARFDPVAHARMVDRVIEAWTPRVVASLPRTTMDTSRPIFICGMPRSGTSLVEQILEMHPDVHGGGEINLLHKLLRPCLEAQAEPSPYLHDPEQLTSERIDALAREYLDALRRLDRRARRVTDKVPLNCMHLGPIACALPQARIVICERDAMDTCLSCFSHDFGGSLPWTYDLAHLGAFWRDCDRLAAHWRSVLDAPIHVVAYEALVRDQEGQTRALLDFLGLDWHDACLRPHESDRLTRTASMDQVRRPVHASAIGRGERFGSALDPLRAALRRGVD